MPKPGDAPDDDQTDDDSVHRPGEDDGGVADTGNPTDPENPTG